MPRAFIRLRSIVPWLLYAALATSIVRPALALTTLRISGDPGDPLTGGTTITYSTPAATIALARTPVWGLECTVSPPTRAWWLGFRGAKTHDLSPGLYGPLVVNAGPNDCSFWESRDANACQMRGSFQVRKLAFAPDGSVRQAWITWATTCNATGPQQYGDLRMNADTTLWQTLQPDVWAFGGDSVSFASTSTDAQGRPVQLQAFGLPPTAIFTDLGNGSGVFRWQSAAVASPTVLPITIVAADDLGARDTATTWVHVMPRTFLGTTSDPGDLLGGGVPDTLSSPMTNFTLLPPQANLGERLVWQLGGDSWEFDLVAPFTDALREGVYDGARSAPFQAKPQPGFSVTTRAGACNHLSGRFAVRRLTRRSDGTLSGIWATIEAHCDNATPALKAEFQFNMAPSLYITAPAHVVVEPGELLQFGVTATDPGGRTVTLSTSTLPAGATFVPSGQGGGSFSWPIALPAGALASVQFFASNDLGVADTVMTQVHVLAPARFVATASALDCQKAGQTIVSTEKDADFRSLPGDSTQVSIYDSVGDYGTNILQMSAPAAFGLRAGQYPIAQSFTNKQDPGLPGLAVYFGSFGYPVSTASFHIRKLRFDSNSRASSLWATWQAGCGSTPTLFGELVLNADTTVYTNVPAFALIERGQPVHFAVSAVHAQGASLSISSPAHPPGSTFTSNGSSGAFAWPSAAPVGLAPATFVSSDVGGHADTVQTLIRVLEPRLLQVDADPSEPTTGGGHFRFDATAGTYSTAIGPTGSVQFHLLRVADDWVVQLAAPTGRSLTPGLYSGAIWPSSYASGIQPKLAVTRSGASCLGGVGSFHVRKYALAADGSISQLWVTFRNACGATTLTGEARYGDPDTTLYLEAPSDLFVDPATSVSFVVHSNHALGRPVALRAATLPSGAALVDHGDGTASFDWNAPAVGGAIFPITIFGNDDQGRLDSCVTVIHVVVPAQLQTQSEPNDRIGGGTSSSITSTSAEFSVHPFLNHGLQIDVVSVSDRWSVYFDGPGDTLLVPGNYPDAVGYWDAPGTHPVVYVTHNWGECYYGTVGQFLISNISYDVSGRLSTLWVDFSQRCGLGAPALIGQIRYGGGFGATATLATRMLASGDNGVAQLRWLVSSLVGPLLELERRDPGAIDWRMIDSPHPNGLGEVGLTDTNVREGQTYTYRLVEIPSGSEARVLDEVSILIKPLGPFFIRSLGPNPATSAVTLRLGGHHDDQVEIALTDVTGRLVLRESLRLTDSGGSSVTMQLPATLPAGLYLLRARSEQGPWLRRRFLVIR